MPRPFWSLRATHNCAIQFNPDRNHLWKWIGINPDRIRIGRMRIQCGRTQTGFDLVQSGSMRIGCPVWTRLKKMLRMGVEESRNDQIEWLAEIKVSMVEWKGRKPHGSLPFIRYWYLLNAAPVLKLILHVRHTSGSFCFKWMFFFCGDKCRLFNGAKIQNHCHKIKISDACCVHVHCRNV